MSERKPFEPLTNVDALDLRLKLNGVLNSNWQDNVILQALKMANAALALDKAKHGAMERTYAKRMKELLIAVLATEQERDAAQAEVAYLTDMIARLNGGFTTTSENNYRLREENEALRAQLSETEAELAALKLQRLP